MKEETPFLLREDYAGIWRYRKEPKTTGGTRHFCEVEMKNGNVQRDIKTWDGNKWILEHDEDRVIRWIDESNEK